MAGTDRRWRARIAVLALLIGSSRVTATEPPESMTIGVLVLNQAEVAPAVLARAKAEAVRIYHRAGVRLRWSDPHEAAVDYRFIVKIVSKTIAGKGVDERAMGVAAGTKEKRGTLAFAFYARITDVTRAIGADTGLILGHVIAHELGHLLLPYDSHAKSGLMRGGWDQEQARLAEKGLVTFTTDEATLIRNRLENVSATAARR